MPWPTNSRTTENPLRLDVRLDRVADVRDPAADLHLRDALVERLAASRAAGA